MHSYETEYLIPIDKYIKQLHQMASNYEWEGNMEACDATLAEMQQVRQYQIDTGSFFYPLF